MNFGIVACESVLTAECVIDSEELNSIKEKWSKMNVNIVGIKCFKVVTNSENSIICIYSIGYRLIEMV